MVAYQKLPTYGTKNLNQVRWIEIAIGFFSCLVTVNLYLYFGFRDQSTPLIVEGRLTTECHEEPYRKTRDKIYLDLMQTITSLPENVVEREKLFVTNKTFQDRFRNFFLTNQLTRRGENRGVFELWPTSSRGPRFMIF